MHTPDNWVILRIHGDDPHYRVLGGWSGGYTTGDSWRLNSGVKSVSVMEDFFELSGSSGSVYRCHKSAYGLRRNNAGIWAQLKDRHGDKIELMPEDTDWTEVDWII